MDERRLRLPPATEVWPNRLRSRWVGVDRRPGPAHGWVSIGDRARRIRQHRYVHERCTLPASITVHISVDVEALQRAIRQLGVAAAAAAPVISSSYRSVTEHDALLEQARRESPHWVRFSRAEPWHVQVLQNSRAEGISFSAEGISFSPDSWPYDVQPDHCWRCDSTQATTEIGLCDRCRVELAEPVAAS